MRTHICAFQLHHGLTQTFHPDLNRIDPPQTQCRIQHHAALFITIRRRICPASAPVDTHRQTNIHLVLCDVALPYIWNSPLGRLIDRLLNRIKTTAFQLIRPVDLSRIPQKMGQGIVQTNLQRKRALFPILPEKIQHAGRDAPLSEDPQRLSVVLPVFQCPEKFLGQNPLLQFLFPPGILLHICLFVTLLQTEPSCLPPTLNLFRRCFSPAHPIQKLRPLQRFHHRIRRNIQPCCP